MRYWVYWLCAGIAVALAIAVVVFLGATPVSLLLALLLLLCPVLVVWGSLRMAKRSEDEINALVSKELKRRLSKRGR